MSVVLQGNQPIAATYSTEQLALIKNTVAKGATNEELALFLYTCQRTGLDPLTRQIYFSKRRTFNKAKNAYDETVTIQTGIDGYRAIAEKSKSLAGIEDPIYDTESESHPNKATVTVHRFLHGQVCKFTASARWSEYYPGEKQGFMWSKMPYLMLGKCAEALALRKAFPNDLSGLYTHEEMQQAEREPINITPTVPQPPQQPETPAEPEVLEPEATEPKKLAAKDIKRLHAQRGQLGVEENAFKAGLSKMVGFQVESLHDLAKLSQRQLKDIMDALDKRIVQKSIAITKESESVVDVQSDNSNG